jgi:phosphotriesterase-related protein
MAKVNAVLGTIEADDIGVTLVHEHLCTGLAGWNCDAFSLPYERSAMAEVCAQALDEARGYGLNTLVDVTPIDLARDVELQMMVSDKTGINIISATGFINEATGANVYFKFRSQIYDVTTEIYEIFMKEITQGIGNTGVKAGVIKVATGHGFISKYEESVLRAAARAHKETGTPVITHTENGTMGLEQADLLISEGCDPERIIIGHIDGNTDTDYHTSVLDRGVFIAFDRMGIDALVPDATRKECVMRLLKLGYADRIMLSHDYILYFLGRTNVVQDFAKAVNPNWSFVHIFKNIMPYLKNEGVTDETINTIMVNNPRRFLTGK